MSATDSRPELQQQPVRGQAGTIFDQFAADMGEFELRITEQKGRYSLALRTFAFDQAGPEIRLTAEELRALAYMLEQAADELDSGDGKVLVHPLHCCCAECKPAAAIAPSVSGIEVGEAEGESIVLAGAPQPLSATDEADLTQAVVS